MVSIVEDVYDLMNQSMLKRTSSLDTCTAASMLWVRIDVLGNKLYELMEIQSIFPEDLTAVYELIGVKEQE